MSTNLGKPGGKCTTLARFTHYINFIKRSILVRLPVLRCVLPVSSGLTNVSCCLLIPVPVVDP